jgi:signal transduction histidine kinase/CheY-like chemotaxis protein/sensor domain CHASE-containing protein
MSLRLKAWLSTLGVLGALMLLLYGVFSYIFDRSFTELQQSFAKRNTHRAARLLWHTIGSHRNTLLTNASWDDTYEYVVNPNRKYEEDNLIVEPLFASDVHVVVVADVHGQIVFSGEFDPETGAPGPASDHLKRILPPGHPLLAHEEPEKFALAAAGDQVLLLASMPILRSDGSGPRHGVMVFGRYLTPKLMTQLQQVGGLKFAVRGLPEPVPIQTSVATGLPGEWIETIEVETPALPIWSDQPFAAKAHLPDLNGEHRIEFTTTLPDTLRAEAKRQLLFLLGFLTATGFIFAAIMIFAMEWLLLRRLQRITDQARSISEQSDLSGRLPVQGTDELASLARSINTMIESLHSLQAELVANEERARRQNQSLIEVSRARGAHEGELQQTFQLITEAGARTLEIGRGSIWLFSKDGQELVCEDLYEFAQHRHTRGGSIPTSQIERYCRHLRESRFVIVTDALNDARVSEFAETYTKPLGIGAFLDVSMTLGDSVVGVICFEHLGGAREWTNDEQNFASSLADAVSLALDDAARRATERAMRKAKELAESANRAKSEFLANMSHEIRTPLNSVLGFSELLQERITDPKLKTYLDAIDTGGRALLHLIDDILDLSKIEAGRLEIQPGPVNLRRLGQDVMSIFARKAEQQDTALHVDIDDSVPQVVLLDELRIRQILFNLVGNAVKFTDHGTVRLSIQAVRPHASAPSSAVHLAFAVQDTGIGIPPEEHARIFEAFSQQSGQSTRKYGGTGLGLAITQRLVKAMNGTISLESERGKGSMFEVYLQDVLVNASATPSPAHTKSAVPLQFQRATVLVVDDVPHNRELARGLLQGRNLQVITAENGREGLDAAVAHHPDLILMDLKMPVMDGFEATQLIRATPAISKVPIIAVTASSLKEDDHSIAKAGFDAFLRKPFRKDSLFREMARFLKPAAPANGDGFQGKTAEIVPAFHTRALSPASFLRWAEARDKVEKSWPEQARALRRSPIMSHVRTFANEVEATARQIDAPELLDAAARLQEAVTAFDADAIARILERFPTVCESTAAAFNTPIRLSPASKPAPT